MVVLSFLMTGLTKALDLSLAGPTDTSTDPIGADLLVAELDAAGGALGARSERALA